MRKSTIILTSFLIVSIIVLALMTVVHYSTKKEMEEMVEQMIFEKEQIEEEYRDLAIQFDGYGSNLQNDSLAQLLGKEQQRVQDLLEELRITKVTNARRIAELKNELATVRKVMVVYVQQIDSLSQSNKRLTDENRQVKKDFQKASERAQQLEIEKNQLTEVVQRAAMLEIHDFSCTQLNSKDKKTNNINKTQKLQLDFTVAKNITTPVGEKTVFIRLVRPDGEIMLKSLDNVFPFENAEIEYSLKTDFEYGGEDVPLTVYWQVEEVLFKGVYNADFFIDGSLIGSFPFTL